MKLFLSLSLLAFITGCGEKSGSRSTADTSVNLDEFLPKIQSEAQEFAEALTQEDNQAVMEKMYSSVAEDIGDDLDDYLAGRLAGIYEQGFKAFSLECGRPETPQKVGKLLISFCPVTTVFNYDDGGHPGNQRIFGTKTIIMTTHLVAVSSNKGKAWSYFEATKPDIVEAYLPEAKGKLLIPSPLIDAQKR